MTTNNQYYKTICEIVTGETITGLHSDNYYLKRIAETICSKTYSTTTCNGKYLKDIAEAECETTYSDHHFNNFYLHQWAEKIIGDDLANNYDNYFLGIIAENIVPTKKVILTSSANYVVSGEDITLTATVLDENNDPIDDVEVVFEADGSSIGSGNTSSLGIVTCTYTGTSAGTVSIVATYDDITSNIVVIDDYTPAANTVVLTTDVTTITYKTDSLIATATVKDQHGENLSSGTVTFYDGETSLGTASVSDGVATENVTLLLNVGTHSLTATIGGKTSNAVVVTVNKATPELTITPPTLVYMDDFSVSGRLKHGESIYLTNREVVLHWLVDGTEHTATTTTGHNGKYTFETLQTTSVSTYKFWVTFAGDSNYNACSSSECTVTVDKETSVLNVDNPSSVVYGNNATVTGTLMDNDSPTATAISGASITVSENGATIGTGTTGNDGAFSISISGLSVGTHSIVVSYAGDNYYTSSSDTGKSIVVSDVPTPVPASVDLTGTKSILSYADSESCTLTATVLDSSDNPVSGATVELYKAGTLWDTLTTNASGEVTKTYSSAGIGDVTFEAKCNLLTKTYDIVDGIYAHLDETLFNATSSTDKSTPFDSNMSLTLPNKFELSFKLKVETITSGAAMRFGLIPVANKSSNTPTYTFYGQQSTSTYVGVYRDSSTHAVGSDTSTTGTAYHDWKIVRNGNTFKWYFDGVQINSDITLYWFDNYAPYLLGWQYWRSGTANVKDIIIKPL